ncbi:MAG TPA: PAS domain S-box protein, partial [Chthoniobacterales bacterium]|nr:PAS domain S-box protein [Chthoniobacterales bacterium]
TDTNLFYLVVYQMANASLKYGTADASVHAYADLGLILGPSFHRYQEGYRFAKLALSLVKKYGFHSYEGRAYYNMEQVGLWTQPVKTAIECIRIAFRACIEAHDLAYASYCCNHLVTDLLLHGVHLDQVWREAQKGLEFVREIKYRDVADVLVSQQRFILNLRGQTTTFSTFSDTEFDEESFEAQLTEDRMPNMICWYWILKLQARFLSGDYAAASLAAEKAKALLWSTEVFIESANYHLYYALTIAALADRPRQDKDAPALQQLLSSSGSSGKLPGHLEQKRQIKGLDALEQSLERLREWAENCRDTFLDKYTLVSAELARIKGRDLEAMRLYEEAIRLSRENGFVQNEGIANELAAAFYASRGFESIAELFLRRARYCYLRWGADGKVRQLDETYPDLRTERAAAGPTGEIEARLEQLDLATVVKISQTVSSEIQFEKLIETLLKVALEHAGAERGLLILPQGEQYRIEAEIKTDLDRVQVQLRDTPITPSELPESLFWYAIRTQEKIILDDASANNMFSEDEYLRQRCPRSILCLPLLKQTKMLGVLYLENNLAPRVFTQKRLAMLELLASQAAISLDHARVYAELAKENAERKRTEEELRRSEAFLAQGQRISHTGSWRWQVATGTVHWSEETFRILDANPNTEKPTYSLFMERVHPEDRDRVEEILNQAVQETIDFDFDYRIVLPKGLIKFLRSVGQPVVGSSGELEFIGTVMDVTESKLAEAELRNQAHLLALAHDAIIVCDAQYRITFWNPGAVKTYGWTDEEAIGKVAPELLQTQFPVSLQAIKAALQEHGEWEGELRHITRQGSPIVVASRWSLRRGERGSETILEISRDITDHKRAEEAWHEAQAELAHVTRVATLGELAGSIAHEVNQPLTAIINNADACLALLPGEISKLDDVREALSDIISDADRASAVLARIRGLIKKSPPQKSRLDLNETIAGVIALTRGQIDRNEVLLGTELANDLPLIIGDRIQLQQVMLNLIINSIEAMSGVSDGPRQLWISSEIVSASEHITPIRRFAGEQARNRELGTRNSEPAHVLVSVADSGPGLDLNNVDRLFNAFYTTKPQGLGMGLSICRSIIGAHGGRLWVRANVPRGALFQFTLPVAVSSEQ